jgi:hypothetical protein
MMYTTVLNEQMSSCVCGEESNAWTQETLCERQVMVLTSSLHVVLSLSAVPLSLPTLALIVQIIIDSG